MRYRNRDRGLTDFIYEAGMLKRVGRSGWSVLGIKNAESVAEHSFRCAVIGYALARMEGVSPYKVLLMTLFNDMQEARITDLHKMAQRYIDSETAEERSFREQIAGLPDKIGKELSAARAEYKAQKSREAVIARDADILECLIQAKEYLEQGHSGAKEFMRMPPRFLRTRSARALWKSAKGETEINGWWLKLSEFKR